MIEDDPVEILHKCVEMFAIAIQLPLGSESRGYQDISNPITDTG
jgi:hypothetical protein